MSAKLRGMLDSTLNIEDVPPGRRIYANRTLNLRTIGAIGYDMDYTLVHYHADVWERKAYERAKDLLRSEGWPVDDLEFDPGLVIRGLVIDAELGNIVKANRFGYVMRANHGTRLMEFEEQREVYRHTPVDLSEPRFSFLNTLFSLSESCLYLQLVDLYDQHVFPNVHGYEDLFRRVRARLDETHIEGTLKAEIMADPEPFIDLDPVRPGRQHVERRNPFPKNPCLIIAVVDHCREIHRKCKRVKFIHQKGVGCHHLRAVIAKGTGGIGETTDHIHDDERGFAAKAKALAFEIHILLK
jgi:hypothetical protein